MTFCKIYDIFEPTKEGKSAICGKDSHGSTLAQLPNGNIITAWYSGSYEKSGDVGIYTSTFDPEEEIWNEVELLEKESPKKSEGNPVFFFDEENDRLWMWWVTMDRANSPGVVNYKHFPGGWSTCKVKVRHSDDLGKTWTNTHYLTKWWGRMTRNKPIRMSNGEVIFPYYSEWLGYKTNFWIASRDEFAKGSHECSWEKIGPIRGGVLQPNVVELDPGHLLCYMRSSKGGKLYPWTSVSESFDYGRNWTKIKKGPVYNCNAGLGMVKLKNGHLALAFNDSPETRNPLSIGISEDNGETWPYVRNLEYSEDKSDRFAYPEIIQAKDGSIYCTYTNKHGINIRCAHFDEEWVKKGE